MDLFHLEANSVLNPLKKLPAALMAALTMVGALAIRLAARVPIRVPAAVPMASALSVRAERMPVSSRFRVGPAASSMPGSASTNPCTRLVTPPTICGIRFSVSSPTAFAAPANAVTTFSALPDPEMKSCQAADAVSRAEFTLSVRVAKPPAADAVFSRIICTA